MAPNDGSKTIYPMRRRVLILIRFRVAGTHWDATGATKIVAKYFLPLLLFVHLKYLPIMNLVQALIQSRFTMVLNIFTRDCPCHWIATALNTENFSPVLARPPRCCQQATLMQRIQRAAVNCGSRPARTDSGHPPRCAAASTLRRGAQARHCTHSRKHAERCRGPCCHPRSGAKRPPGAAAPVTPNALLSDNTRSGPTRSDPRKRKGGAGTTVREREMSPLARITVYALWAAGR
jgi:hypothetical protein